MPRPSITREQVLGSIKLYVARHPQAKDSLRGVAAWCRIMLGVTPSESLVKAAIDELVESGAIVCVRLADGTRIYGAPQQH